MKYVFLVLSLMISIPVFSSEWELHAKAETPSDVEIYTRYVEGQQMKKFKGITTVEAPMEVVLEALSDINNQSDWIYKGKSTKVIQNDQGKPFFYLQIFGIWPAGDRDAVMDVSISQHPISKVVTIETVTAPEFYPEQEDHVRMPSVESSFEVIPVEKNKTKVVFYGHGDPGGSIPSWLANLFVTNLPEVSLTNLHDLVKKPEYQVTDMSQVTNSFQDTSHFLPPEF